MLDHFEYAKWKIRCESQCNKQNLATVLHLAGLGAYLALIMPQPKMLYTVAFDIITTSVKHL